MEQRETLGDCLLSEPRQLGEMCSKSLEDEERAFCLFCFEGPKRPLSPHLVTMPPIWAVGRGVGSIPEYSQWYSQTETEGGWG